MNDQRLHETRKRNIVGEYTPDLERMGALDMLTRDWDGIDMYAALNVIAARLQEREWPALETGDDQDGQPYWTCPHCGDGLREVIEIDWSIRENYGEWSVNTPYDLEFDQGNRDHQTLAYKCTTCHGIVDLAEGMEADYS